MHQGTRFCPRYVGSRLVKREHQFHAPLQARIEEVVVTATRRTTDQQSTALSITTVTSEQIAKRFMTDLRGVADLAPNVVMENVTGFNAAAFAIRGQGTNTGAAILVATMAVVSAAGAAAKSNQARGWHLVIWLVMMVAMLSRQTIGVRP